MNNSKDNKLDESEIKINLGSRLSLDSPINKQQNILLQRYDHFIREHTNCPVCKKETSSIQRKVPGELTWMWCTFASTLSLCFLPFFIDSCNDI
jgi:hypothetical protein